MLSRKGYLVINYIPNTEKLLPPYRLEIKLSKDVKKKLRNGIPKKFRIGIAYRNLNSEGRMYHYPKREFKDLYEVISYFMDNNDTGYLKVKVISIEACE